MRISQHLLFIIYQRYTHENAAGQQPEREKFTIRDPESVAITQNDAVVSLLKRNSYKIIPNEDTQNFPFYFITIIFNYEISLTK